MANKYNINSKDSFIFYQNFDIRASTKENKQQEAISKLLLSARLTK